MADAWNPKLFVNYVMTGIVKCVECNKIPKTLYTKANGQCICTQCKNTRYKNQKYTKALGLQQILDNQLKIRCPNSIQNIENNNNDNNDILVVTNRPKNTCNWIGQISNLQNHDIKCEFKKVLCKYCENAYEIRLNMKNHHNICTEYVLTCVLCDTKHKRKDGDSHINNVCPNYLLECALKCGSKIKRKDLLEHKSDICPKRLVWCKFSKYGCDVSTLCFEKLEKHNKEYEIKHLVYKLDFIENDVNVLKNENIKLKSIIKELKYIKLPYIYENKLTLNKNTNRLQYRFKMNTLDTIFHNNNCLEWNYIHLSIKLIKKKLGKNINPEDWKQPTFWSVKQLKLLNIENKNKNKYNYSKCNNISNNTYIFSAAHDFNIAEFGECIVGKSCLQFKPTDHMLKKYDSTKTKNARR